MRFGGRASTLLVALTVALALPAAAWGHASLLATQPAASGVLSQPPTQVRLTYSERIEPRFAVISVTDAQGNQEMVGSPARAPDDENTIFIKLRHLPQGWYLVWWRVISADGHPVRGAFTFAVGPSPGPPPQFVIPSLGESAATPSLIGSRWVLLIALAAAVGLVAFRAVIARPLQVKGGSERALRSVTLAAGLALTVALVAAPIYLVLATAEFSLRPWTDLGAIVPLVRDSGFGRAFSDLWGVLALLAAASAIALTLDRPGPPRRSGEALLRCFGAAACAAAALALPGLAGHPATTSPVGLMLALDWAHLAAASIWIGGLSGPARARRRERGRQPRRRARRRRTALLARRNRECRGAAGDRDRREHRAPPHAGFALADGLRPGADREERPAGMRSGARSRQQPPLEPPACRGRGAP